MSTLQSLAYIRSELDPEAAGDSDVRGGVFMQAFPDGTPESRVHDHDLYQNCSICTFVSGESQHEI